MKKHTIKISYECSETEQELEVSLHYYCDDDGTYHIKCDYDFNPPLPGPASDKEIKDPLGIMGKLLHIIQGEYVESNVAHIGTLIGGYRVIGFTDDKDWVANYTHAAEPT